MKNKIFLLALIIPLTFKTGIGKDVCDDLLLNYEVLMDRNDHTVQIQNNYYYSINSGVIKSLTITTGDITENRIRIPEINLITGDNILRIYKEQEQIYNETIRYNSPDIRVSGLGSLEKIGDFYILKGLNELILGIKEAPVICADNGGLNKIKYYLNEFAIDSLTQRQAGEGTDIQINNFNGGINTLTFEIEGNFDGDILNKYPEYRELVTKEIMFFYIGIQDLPPSFIENKICFVDDNIELTGIPGGGYFEGPGIVGKTNIFNPTIANQGIHEILYVYDLNGSIIRSEPKIIEVSADYNFSINGQNVVCINSTCLEYTLEGSNLDNYSFEWEIEGGEIILPDTQETSKFIQWENNVPSGKIKVTAIPENGHCISIQELIIHIKANEAPPRSYPVFVDAEMKLLACSDVNAKTYRWLKVVDDAEVFLGETDKPYYIHEAGAKVGETFYVETAYNDELCYTRSFPCNFGNNWNSHLCGLLKSADLPEGFNERIDFYVHTDLVTIRTSLNQKHSLKIFDFNGRLIYHDRFNYEISVGKNLLKNGTYIFIVESNKRVITKKILGF